MSKAYSAVKAKMYVTSLRLDNLARVTERAASTFHWDVTVVKCRQRLADTIFAIPGEKFNEGLMPTQRNPSPGMVPRIQVLDAGKI